MSFEWRGGWRLRWREPGGRHRRAEECETLARRAGCADTAEFRHASAIEKRKQLERDRDRRRGLPAGGLTIADALADRLTTMQGEGKARRTLATFKDRIRAFADWSRDQGVRTCDEFTMGHVKSFRAHVLSLQRRRVRPGTKRGAKGVKTGRPLSGTSKRKVLTAALDFLRRYTDLDPSRVALTMERKAIKKGARASIVLLGDVGEVQQTVKAALAYDAEQGEPLLAPMVLAGLLGGFRAHDFGTVRWDAFRPNGRDPQSRDGGPHGVLDIPEWHDKKPARTIGLAASPALKRLLLAMRLRAGDAELVFGVSEDRRQFLKKCLREAGAPAKFSWVALRRTCATVSRTSRNLFANEGLVDDRMGHRFDTARRHYVGEAFGFDPDATTIEGALKIEVLARRVVASVQPAARARA